MCHTDCPAGHKLYQFAQQANVTVDKEADDGQGAMDGACVIIKLNADMCTINAPLNLLSLPAACTCSELHFRCVHCKSVEEANDSQARVLTVVTIHWHRVCRTDFP